MPETSIFLSPWVGSAITTISGGAIGYFSAARAATLMTRSIAVAKFRASFAPALARIRLDPDIQRDGTSQVADFFKEVWLTHAAAIEEFRPFVSEGAAYEKAWDEYKNVIASKSFHDGGIGWDTGVVITVNGEAISYWPLVRVKIESILHFTDQQYSTDWLGTTLKRIKMAVCNICRQPQA